MLPCAEIALKFKVKNCNLVRVGAVGFNIPTGLFENARSKKANFLTQTQTDIRFYYKVAQKNAWLDNLGQPLTVHTKQSHFKLTRSKPPVGIANK
ncbi:hypothetical protein L596_024541 [Steinernema carpocapsae]|uniref:Uncharacterized protein n=1 Tax=Steinernema carpocapsae TaxID=34508 RepID=A0A4U5MH28_STECR|nr:hypothetical protein L596_024541 [Steinernema carpocapsae]